MTSLAMAGIDEAGLGPLLGPLCIGFVTIHSAELCDLWQDCPALFSKQKIDEEKLAVADSKQIYQSGNGIRRLEETVLAFYFAKYQKLPTNIANFLNTLNLEPSAKSILQHPWYQKLDLPLPLEASSKRIMQLGERIQQAFQPRKLKISSMGVRVVPEIEWNQSLKQTQNKSISHFAMFAEVIRHITQTNRSKQTEIFSDRLGMRTHYAPLLSNVFPGAPLWILRELQDHSSYQIEFTKQKMRIGFFTRGDDRYFTTALASMFAKYTRELLMKCWNNYFQKIAPDVRPTAGYYADARRYLREADSCLSKAQINKQHLVRAR